MKKTKVYLAHPHQATRDNIAGIIASLDHELVGQSSTLEAMDRDCATLKPDLIVSAFAFPQGIYLDTDLASQESNPIPCIIVAMPENRDKVEKAMQDHVMAYLIDPVDKDDLGPTIHVVLRRFEEMENLRKEVGDLKAALVARKKMERAKGLLMSRADMDEEAAYLHLRRMATSQRIRMEDAADLVILDGKSPK